MTPQQNLPQHIGIIMDGNRRWARQHKLQILQGHEYVANKVIEPLVERCIEQGIPYLTLWAFSTENWKREKEEVEGLMNLFRDAFGRNAQKLFEKGVRLRYVGNLEKFPTDIHQKVLEWQEKTAKNTKITVTFALNYGGRDEIVRAVNSLLQKQPETKKMTEQDLSAHLDSAGFPDPDLVIRPGGEQRLSGFLPWQTVYSELYFTDILMPDFGPAQLDEAIAEYQQRQRRFGT